MSDDDSVSIERRMPSGRPLLDIRLRLMTSEDGYRAVEITMVPKLDVEEVIPEDELPHVYVPLAYWDDFVENGTAVASIGRRAPLHAHLDGVGGIIVPIQGERHEGALAVFLDNQAYWARLAQAVEVAEMVSDDVPAPVGSVYMICDGLPRIVVPKVSPMRGNYRLAPGFVPRREDIPDQIAKRGNFLASLVNPQTTTLRGSQTGDEAP